MIDRVRACRLVALLAITMSFIAAMFGPSAVMAQPGTPVILVNGDSVGPVAVVNGSSPTTLVTGLTPNAIFTLSSYNGPGCAALSLTGPASSNANGEYTSTGPIIGVQTISFRAFDTINGTSNCLTVNVVSLPPPVLSIESDSVGPVELEVGSNAAIHITGLTPESTFTLNVYNGVGCATLADGGPNPSNGDGEYFGSIPYVEPQTVSYQAVDTVTGTSNCVTVHWISITAPVLSINSDSVGPVNVVVGSSGAFLITGLTPDTTSTLIVFTGTDCMFPADDSPVLADADGEVAFSAPFGSVLNLSYQAVDAINGPSNCVAVIVSALPTETPVPTATSTETPVPTATSTETPVPTATSTETPVPTATSTETPVPTATSTETPLPTATSTETPVPTATLTETPLPTATSTETPIPTATSTETTAPTATSTEPSAPTEPVEPTATSTTDPGTESGTAVITITTADGSDIPDGTSVCLGDDCKNLDAAASLVAAAAVSGTQVSFSGLPPGTYPLTVVIGGEEVYASTVDIVTGETTNVTITLSPGGGPATPIAPNPTKAPPVVQLPSTGAGSSSSAQFTMLFMLGGVMLLTAGVVWRRWFRY